MNVSRETAESLRHFEAQLLRWTKTINLVSGSQQDDFWTRHIEDSLQLLEFAPKGIATWLDAGSGGGLPGLVVAIALKEVDPAARMVLVESDKRKATFLRSMIRELDLNADVLTERIEALVPQNAQVFSARALAPLSTLLTYASRHMSEDGTALLPKGANFQKEIDEARSTWDFELATYPSRTDPRARILEVRQISQKGQG